MKTQITKSLLILTLALMVSACGEIDIPDEVTLNRDPNLGETQETNPNQEVASENPEGDERVQAYADNREGTAGYGNENYGSPGDAPAYQGESIITNTYGGQVGGDGICNYTNFGASSYASPGC